MAGAIVRIGQIIADIVRSIYLVARYGHEIEREFQAAEERDRCEVGN